MATNTLVLENVSYKYKNSEAWIVRNISFHIGKGELSVLMGPSGSGKSTILKLIRGMYRELGGDFSGKILINGKDTAHISTAKLGSLVGIVFQNPSYQLHQPRVLDEVMSAPMYQGLPWDECIERALTATKGVIDDSLLWSNPAHLSFGQQQRVAIAASIALNADMILLDEPFSYLDGNGIANLKFFLNHLLAEGKTILVATHDIEPLARFASSIVLINNGILLDFGKPSRVLYSDLARDSIGESLFVKTAKNLSRNNVALEIPLCWDDITASLNLVSGFRDVLPTHDLGKNESVIDVNNAWYRYPNGSEALRDVSITVNKRNVFGLLGPNGCGKSTLARLILGLIKPQKGTVKFKGKRADQLRNRALQIGYISQNPTDMIFETTVLQECCFGPRTLRMNNAKQRALTALSKFGLERYELRDPRSLSGGEQRLLTIASILVNEPDVVVFDEPEFGLDVRHFSLVTDIIRALSDQEKTVLLITHKLEIAAFLCTHLAFMVEGKLKVVGNTEEVLFDSSLSSIIGDEKSFLICWQWIVQKLGHLPQPNDFVEALAERMSGV